MSTTATAPAPSSAESPAARSRPVDALAPGQVRVVDVECDGRVLRLDCYVPDGSLAADDPTGVRSVFRLVDGIIHVQTIDWAQSRSLNSSVEVTWRSTGLRVADVDRIRVYTWPDGELVRIFREQE